MKHLFALVISAFLLQGSVAWGDVKIGEAPPEVELKDKLGGRLDGSAWSSRELTGKVHVLFYVDPDEKDLNNETSEALDKEKFPAEKFASVAVINMAATLLPNFMISSSLKKKQERYPRTLYVRDKKKVLVHAWNIADDNSNVLAFDKEGRLIFRKDGQLQADEIRLLIQVVQEHL
jgi:uncharacterized protein